MTDAVKSLWHGANYQARIFWENALNLLDPTSGVVEVTFEANGPKAFDDVVVKYSPPVPRSGAERIEAEYHQVKWHVEYGGRFGYADLINPAFIGAQSTSLLERLKQARAVTPPNSLFSFITTYRTTDGDPLSELISGTDKSLLVEKLFDKTKTDASRMGEVRKLWRDHLKLSTNEELRAILTGFRIIEGHRSLDEMRQQINIKAQIAGLMTCGNLNSDFRYDELARQLKIRDLSSLTKEVLKKICEEEKLFVSQILPEESSLKIAIRSFIGPAADVVGATPENTLILTDEFRQRYLLEDLSWQKDIRPKVESFLRAAVKKSPSLQIILDAHASIAYLAGYVLDLKSAVKVSIVQKGRVGSHVWAANEGPSGEKLKVEVENINDGQEIAISIGISRSAKPQTKSYVSKNLPAVGKIVDFSLPEGPGQQNVLGGKHAAALAEQISNYVRDLKADNLDVLVHIFGACPNSLLFFLGQSHQGISPSIIYEFDFDRGGNKTYQPSFIID